MKKTMKMALVLCLAALLLLAGGCSKKDPAAALVGVWELTDMTGTEDAVLSMQYYRNTGVKMQIAISLTDMVMVYSASDGSVIEHQTVNYTLEGDKLVTETSELVYSLKGDTLSLTNEGVTMVYTRK